jgi:thiol:disulfide interchange protein DsbD
VWLFGRAGHAKRKITTFALQLAAVGACGAALILAYPDQEKLQRAREAGSGSATRAEGEPDIHGLLWERYSEERVNELQQAGTPLYVDFTAEWCITCQVNDGVVFGSAEVRELLRQKKVVLLRADWTSMNPAITAALKTHGKNGVPLNLLYKGRKSAGESGAPIVFPNILTPGTVLKELRSIAE